MRNILLFGWLLLFFSGCTKNDDLGFPVTDGERLVRYVEIYNSREYKMQEYIYDDQNQLNATEFRYFGSIPTGKIYHF